MGRKYKIPSSCMLTTNRKIQNRIRNYKFNNQKLSKPKEKIAKQNKMRNN
jgi:hypothetical protein